MKIAINGRFVVRKQTGQERFACELLKQIDLISLKNELTLVVPLWADDSLLPKFCNIKIVKYGRVRGLLWEQVNFYWWVKKHGMTSLNLTTTCPLLDPGIVCIHDCEEIDRPDLLKHNIYGRLSLIWHILIIRNASKFSKHLITVSKYSKQKLHALLNVPEMKISVIYNAWQHFDIIKPDFSIFEQIPKNIKRKDYFMALSSMTPQKNFKWIYEIAKRNSEYQFVVSGARVGLTSASDVSSNLPNIFFTGYLTDARIKALMMNCKAFLHPAIYEGFGIPPLEALSCGAKLILSDCTCLPEIYENSAHYIDPYDYDVNLEKLLEEQIDSPNKILEKFNWKRESAKLYFLLKKLDNTCFEV